MRTVSAPRTVKVTIDGGGGVCVTADGVVVLRIEAAEVIVADDPVRGLDVVHGAGAIEGKYVMVDGVQVFKSYADYCSS